MITKDLLKDNAAMESYVYIADKFKQKSDLNTQRLEKIKELLKKKENDN